MGEDDKVKKPFKDFGRVNLGKGDLDKLEEVDPEEGGMLMGPGHPIFKQRGKHPDELSANPLDPTPHTGPVNPFVPRKDKDPDRGYPFPEGTLPRGAHPKDARFDPITPFGEEFSGEPDFDELLPPPQRNPKKSSDAPTFGPFDGSAGSSKFFK